VTSPSAASSLFAEAALDYAARGWRIVPLHSVVDGRCSCGRDCTKSAGKHPRLSKWTEAATSDAAVVSGWWRQWPEANIGVALGVRSGIVAVDIDSEAGSKLLLEMSGGQLPETLEYTTGNGSRLLFAIPGNLPTPPKTRVLDDASGNEAVRLQSDGGQCVMPPSSHYTGRSYQWVEGRGPDQCRLAEMPGWLVAEMCLPDQPDWSSSPHRATNDLLPGVDFNRRATWEDILEPHGWTRGGGRGDKQYWTRPGKTGGPSATIGHFRANDGTPALYVFTGNAPPLKAQKCYDRFGAYTWLNHGGTFADAARELGLKGFGQQKKQQAGGRRAEARENTSLPANVGVPNSDSGESPSVLPPHSSTGPAIKWAEPIPLKRTDSPVMPFPVDALPVWLRQFVLSVAQIVNVPVDYPATFALGMAAGVIGSTLEVEITPEWRELPNLLVAVVAPKSSGKSPSLKAVQHPLRRVQSQRIHESSDGKAMGIYTTNCTVEGIIPQLKKHQRGTLVIADELSGWLASFDQYKSKGSGSDRQFWLTNWSGGDHSVVRKDTDTPIAYISDPCVSIVGGIQPSVLVELAKGRDDGLLERFLLSYPEPLPPGPIHRSRYEGARDWEMVVDLLSGREMQRGQYGPLPTRIQLSPEAQIAFDEFYNSTARYCEVHPLMTGFRMKLNSYAARLALVLHATENHKGNSVAEDITGSLMVAAIRLTHYFLSHAEKVFAERLANPHLSSAAVLLDWLVSQKIQEFTRREAHRATHRNWQSSADLAEPLRLLTDYGYVAIAPSERRDSARYLVNPNLKTLAIAQKDPTVTAGHRSVTT
jgi:Protein of unknown function (DUF3987)/Bifunctional DNA primase/polymerase, N-terminal